MKKLLLFFKKNPKKIGQLFYNILKLIMLIIIATCVSFLTAIFVLILIPIEFCNKKIRVFKQRL